MNRVRADSRRLDRHAARPVKCKGPCKMCIILPFVMELPEGQKVLIFLLIG